MHSTIRRVAPLILVALLAPESAALAQASDGSIVAWGDAVSGQCTVPPPNSGFAAVAAGHSHSLGLKTDGSIVAWGNNANGQCDVPSPNTGFMAVAAGLSHGLGLKIDGSIIAWGRDDEGQCTVPSPNTGFTAMAGGGYHSLGLKTDGSIVAWGDNYYAQCTVPAPNTGFTAVAAGRFHSLGLKTDGSIVAWGGNAYGQCTVPLPNTGFTAVAAGFYHSLCLKTDGSIVAWGENEGPNGGGQCIVPPPNSDFTAIAGGGWHSLGLRNDGTIVGWGDDFCGQCTVPLPNTDFTAVAAGGEYSLGLKGVPFALTILDEPDDQGGYVSCTWARHEHDRVGQNPAVSYYELQRLASSWTAVQLVMATKADTYSIAISTPDILTIGVPAPSSDYRLIARTTDPMVNYVTPECSGYSIDNLPPPAPVLVVEEDEAFRSIFATGSRPSDYEETCFYRGQEPGFTPSDPIQCSTSRWYDEEHLRTYFYKARNFDIHGNPSEWSNEVTGQYPTDVPGAAITQLRLYSNQPNPFNPRTTLRFDLPEPGAVRLSVYDVAGRLLKVLVGGELPAGNHEAVWDGRDAAGRALASGSYFARLEAGGKVEGVRMSLVR